MLPDPELEAVMLSVRNDLKSPSVVAEGSVGLYSAAESRDVEILGSGGRLGRREETEETMLETLSSIRDPRRETGVEW